MQSFTFNELNERGQVAALQRYGERMTDYGAVKDQPQDQLKNCFYGFRFNIHGERIA